MSLVGTAHGTFHTAHPAALLAFGTTDAARSAEDRGDLPRPKKDHNVTHLCREMSLNV